MCEIIYIRYFYTAYRLKDNKSIIVLHINLFRLNTLHFNKTKNYPIGIFRKLSREENGIFFTENDI